MPFVKCLCHLVLLFGIVSCSFTVKRRPQVFVLCLKGFRWDLPYFYSHLPHLRQLARTGSRALWVESEFGGTQTNLLSLMSGLHVEYHARRDFIETIPVLNEHVGGHTRLFHWPWFDRDRNHSVYKHLRSDRKGQPEVIQPYSTDHRMSIERLTRSIALMFHSLTNGSDRTNLIMSFVDEPYQTLTQHGIKSAAMRRTMITIDRLIGRLLSITRKSRVNLIILGDHGMEPLNCRQPIFLDTVLTPRLLNDHTDRHSGTTLSFVLYPKTHYNHRFLLNQLKAFPNDHIQIYSNVHDRLPPKLRLPTVIGRPPPIILFPKPRFYFSYKTDGKPRQCSNKNPHCSQPIAADYSDDPRHLSMRTALFAHGPLFKRGHINQPVLITDVYALLRQVLCLSPFPSARDNGIHVHQMLDLTSLSNTCTYLHLSSVNMIESVARKPTYGKPGRGKDFQVVYVNITENRRPPSHNVIRMHVILD